MTMTETRQQRETAEQALNRALAKARAWSQAVPLTIIEALAEDGWELTPIEAVAPRPDCIDPECKHHRSTAAAPQPGEREQALAEVMEAVEQVRKEWCYISPTIEIRLAVALANMTAVIGGHRDVVDAALAHHQPTGGQE